MAKRRTGGGLRAGHWTQNLKGTPKRRGRMNKTEQAYAGELELRRHAGEVLWWVYESVKLKLGSKCYYTADFAVMLADGTLELHEVKGFTAEASQVRIKSAAAKYPFVFVKVRKKGRGFERELIAGE